MSGEKNRDIMIPDPAVQEINLLELCSVIVRRRRTIVKICAVAITIAVIYSLTLPNIYTGKASILPPQKESAGGLTALLGQMGGLASLAGGIGLGGGNDLYMGILKSRSVADAVIKRLDLQTEFKKKTPDETRLVLERVVRFQAGKDGIVTITAQSKKPELAAKLANTFVEELGRKSVQLNLTKAGTERVFLEKRLEVVKQDLKAAENALRSFQERNKAIKVDTQALGTFEGIAKLKAELASREVQLATLRSFQTDENQDVKNLQTAVTKLKGQISSLAGSGGAGDAVLPVGSMPSLGMEYVRLLREVKVQEAIFEQLTKQYEMAKLTEAKDSSTIQILDEAVVPIKKSKPKRSLIVILTAFTSLVIGVVTVFIQENLAKMPESDRTILNDMLSMLSFRFRR